MPGVSTGPEHYFNEENLRRAYREPGGTLIDFIRVALGRLRIKSREEKIEETFRAWLVSRSLTADQATYLSLLKNRGIAVGRVRLDELFEPPLSILVVAGKGIALFGEQGLKSVIGRSERRRLQRGERRPLTRSLGDSAARNRRAPPTNAVDRWERVVPDEPTRVTMDQSLRRKLDRITDILWAAG